MMFTKWPVLVLPLALLAVKPVSAQNCPVRSYWPTAAWQDRVDEVAIAQKDDIKALEKYAFTLKGDDEERKGVRTDSVVIVHRGDIIYERYARGWDKTKKHLAWSTAKSVTNALVGVAVAHGALTLTDSICLHIKDVPKDNCDITVQNALEFATGLDWVENYEDQSYQTSSVLAMLYGEGRADMAKFVADHSSRDAPGTTFQYSTGDTVLLSAALTGALGPRYGEDFAWSLLFNKVGMNTVAFERDNAGTFAGGSFFLATARDYARFGYLFLNDGCWEGVRLLPEEWVTQSTTVSEPFKTKRIEKDSSWVCGRQWWLNRPVPEQDMASPWPGVPEDTYSTSGHWGQFVIVVPSMDLVIVRLGDDRDGTFDFEKFLKLAIAVAE